MNYDETTAYLKRVKALVDFCKTMDNTSLPIFNLIILEEKLSEAPYKNSSIMYKDLKHILEEFRKAYEK